MGQMESTNCRNDNSQCEEFILPFRNPFSDRDNEVKQLEYTVHELRHQLRQQIEACTELRAQNVEQIKYCGSERNLIREQIEEQAEEFRSMLDNQSTNFENRVAKVRDTIEAKWNDLVEVVNTSVSVAAAEIKNTNDSMQNFRTMQNQQYTEIAEKIATISGQCSSFDDHYNNIYTDFNDIIANHQDSINALKTRQVELENELNDMNYRVETLEGLDKHTSTYIAALERRIEELQNKFTLHQFKYHCHKSDDDNNTEDFEFITKN